MQNKKDGIVDIKGKPYMLINQRLISAHNKATDFEVRTEMLKCEDGIIVFKADVILDSKCYTGHAMEEIGSSQINNNSALENCETSAVGRALGFAGFGLDTSIASAEEVIQSSLQQSKGEVQKSIRKMDISETFIPFKNGKNAGKPLHELDKNSLEWIRDKSTMNEEIKLFVHNYIKSKFETEIEEAPLNIGS
tara:strand:+ start:6669 stop:7247 length:579 start_codon:yes stop_codon:yes gene_type:complete